MSGMNRIGVLSTLFFSAVVAVGLFGIGCGDGAPEAASEPAVAEPAPAVPEVAAEEPEVVDELTPAEQAEISAKMVERAKVKITPENAAMMADALEKEIDSELVKE